MLSTRVAIDIIFIALVVVAVVITAIVAAKVLTDGFSGIYLNSAQVPQDESLQESGDTEAGLMLADPDVGLEETGKQVVQPNPGEQIASVVYGSWSFTLPITWGAVAGTLIWRGKVRSAWSRQGYDYDTFKLVTKMRGSPMRIRLLNAVRSEPKNKLQLAKELDVNWKTIDNHIGILLQSRLVEERTVVGTSRYYAITASGTKVLSLLSDDALNGDKIGSN